MHRFRNYRSSPFFFFFFSSVHSYRCWFREEMQKLLGAHQNLSITGRENTIFLVLDQIKFDIRFLSNIIRALFTSMHQFIIFIYDFLKLKPFLWRKFSRD
jgi:hypothetical protein